MFSKAKDQMAQPELQPPKINVGLVWFSKEFRKPFHMSGSCWLVSLVFSPGFAGDI